MELKVLVANEKNKIRRLVFFQFKPNIAQKSIYCSQLTWHGRRRAILELEGVAKNVWNYWNYES